MMTTTTEQHQPQTTSGGLLIEQCHGLVQIQDAGRFGYAALGITQGGWLDATSARLANALVGNRVSDFKLGNATIALARPAAVLEIPLGGFRVQALHPCCVAVTGANWPLYKNGIPVSRYSRIQLQQGDRLSIGFTPNQGARCYLAVHGGFQTPVVLGSQSMVFREQLSPATCTPLQIGQVLACASSLDQPHNSHPVSLAYPWHYRHRRFRRLALVLGAQAEQCHTVLPSFFNQIFSISPASDRMGVRLKGQPLAIPPCQMVSEGLWAGAVQLPPDGHPIVMLRDHQTMGGYPKLGAICRQSQAFLAQALPGDSCQFHAISAEQALLQARQHEQQLQSLEQQLWAELTGISLC